MKLGIMPLGLSRREFQVASMAASGGSNRMIAQALGLTVSTVKSYIYIIFRKLHVNNRVTLAAWYLENVVIDEQKNPWLVSRPSGKSKKGDQAHEDQPGR